MKTKTTNKLELKRKTKDHCTSNTFGVYSQVFFGIGGDIKFLCKTRFLLLPVYKQEVCQSRQKAFLKLRYVCTIYFH